MSLFGDDISLHVIGGFLQERILELFFFGASFEANGLFAGLEIESTMRTQRGIALNTAATLRTNRTSFLRQTNLIEEIIHA